MNWKKMKNMNFINWGKIKNFLSAGNFFILLGLLLIFFIALRQPTDPDMGWHLKDGEYLLENNMQVAKLDIFSHTMPDFPLIMHEWTSDMAMFFIYEKAGLFVLSLVFALIAAAAFITVSFGVRSKKEYKIIAAILGTIASIPILGVRPQMLSLLGLALVVFVIFRFREKQESNMIYFLPLLFFLWVNMHGGFSVGLFFIALFLFLEFAKLAAAAFLKKIKQRNFTVVFSQWLEKNTLQWKHFFRLSGVLACSCLATLVNPYGWRIYIEVITTIFDSYAKANIGEWTSVTLSSPMSFQFIVYLTLLVILLLMSRKKIDWTYLILSSIFLYTAFSSWRNMPIFLIISTPLWVNIVESLVGMELLRIIQKKWFLILMAVAVGIIAYQQVKIVSAVTSSIDELARIGNYPLGAVRYLKENPIEGHMFNEYNWGGFLIWQYPEKKTFLDGRMPSWRIGKQNIFREFSETMSYNDGWEKTFEKYDVSFALVYNNAFNKIMFERIGWKQVYGDILAAIYKK